VNERDLLFSFLPVLKYIPVSKTITFFLLDYLIFACILFKVLPIANCKNMAFPDVMSEAARDGMSHMGVIQ